MGIPTLGLCLLIAACVPADGGEDAAPPAPEKGHVDIDGVTLEYRDYGGTGDLLLFVPSLFMTADVYDRVAPHFTDRYRVLAVTHRWHGTSEQTGLDFTLDTLALDLAGFIEHFTDEPAIVVGWSQAGMLLPRLARLRPADVRALIFANAVWEPMEVPPGLTMPGQISPDSVYPSLEAAADDLQPLLAVDRPKALKLLSSVFRQREDGAYIMGPPFDSPEVFTRFAALADAWTGDDYDGIGVPVLAIRVQQSKARAAELARRGLPQDSIDMGVRFVTEYDDVRNTRGLARLLAAVPDAEVVVLDDVSHNFVIESPEVVSRVVDDFLHRIER